MTQPTTPPWGDQGSQQGHASQAPYGQAPYGQAEDAPPWNPAHRSAGGYPAPGAYGGYAPPARPATPTLGRVALAAGAVALIGSIVNALVIGAMFTPSALDAADGGNIAVLMSLGLANLLLVWFGFGLWAIIQGCVAISQRRGVGSGIAALVLGLIGPWVGVVIAIATFTAAFADV